MRRKWQKPSLGKIYMKCNLFIYFASSPICLHSEGRVFDPYCSQPPDSDQNVFTSLLKDMCGTLGWYQIGSTLLPKSIFLHWLFAICTLLFKSLGSYEDKMSPQRRQYPKLFFVPMRKTDEVFENLKKSFMWGVGLGYVDRKWHLYS